jgi:23S rRNA (uracil1939-C5)-methyltransferase
MTEVVVDVESLAPGGDAVGRQRGEPGDPNAGRVVFIPLAAPGERVRARLVREKGRVAWGELTSVERPGADRVEPRCPLFGQCGGCQWQHVSLEAQRAAKKAIVERALGIAIPAVVSAGPELGYRDRAQLAVGADPTAGGRRAVGFRARRSNEIVDVPGCPLLTPALAAALPAVRAVASGLPAGSEIDLQAGADGVHANIGRTDASGAARARREFDRLSAAGVVGLSLAGQPALGRGAVDVSEPGGAPLPIPAGGFAQVGREANGVLVTEVLRAAGGERSGGLGVVLELYAGSGNFTRHLLPRAASVHACDADAAAVARGRRAVPGAVWSGPIPDMDADLVVLDPPRDGADPPSLRAALRARRIVYVSCDPQTLSRDARRIAAAGFRLTGAVAIDLLPQAFHVEVVAVFDRV